MSERRRGTRVARLAVLVLCWATLVGNTAGPSLQVDGLHHDGPVQVKVEGDRHRAPVLIVSDAQPLRRVVVFGEDNPRPLLELRAGSGTPLPKRIDLHTARRQVAGKAIGHPSELGRYRVEIETIDGRSGRLVYEIVEWRPAGYGPCSSAHTVRRGQ